MRSYFIITVIILTMVTTPDKIIAENSFKSNPLQQKSVSNHIKHFQQCGIDSGDIDIKMDSDDKSAIPLIAYMIKGHSIDPECLLSSKSRANPIVKENSPLLFESLYDYGMGESEFPLKEGLIELDDKILIFTAPSSDLGIEEIKNVSNEYIVIKVGTFTYSSNFLVSTNLMEITYLSDGRISVVDQEKLILKASGRKSYWKEGGAFWYDALIDKTGKLIDIVSVKDKGISHCYSMREFLKKSNIELPNTVNHEICVEQ
jgi:hypothetical protein